MVGAFCELRPDDAIAAHYRDPFVVYMMRGAEMARLVAQVLGKVGGYNKGRSVPFTGPVDLNIVPWVAGDLGTSLGVATGAALAFQQEGSDAHLCLHLWRWHGQSWRLPREPEPGGKLAAAHRLRLPAQRLGDLPARQRLSAGPRRRIARRDTACPGVAVDGNDLDAVRRTMTRPSHGRARARDRL